MITKIRVAVIGVGHLGQIHAKIYKNLEQCSLAGVCDIEATRLKQVSTELAVESASDYKQLYGKVDAVSIVVPTQLHFQIAKDFLLHGVHCLVEKPFTKTLRDADKLIALAAKNKLILQVGHVERFNSAYAATKELITEPRFIECHRLSAFPQRSLDIGVVLDLMIHDIDIVLGLVNSPIKSISAVGVPVLTPFEDIANARITFKNGCVCNLTASRVSDETVRKIRIFLNNTYISLDYKNEEAFVYKKTAAGISKESLPIEKEQPLQKELASFIECIMSGSTPVVSGETARQALAVALTINRKILG